MQPCIKVFIIFKDTPNKNNNILLHVFGIVLAEVIYQKNTISILQSTIEPPFTIGFKTLTQNSLTSGLSGIGEVYVYRWQPCILCHNLWQGILIGPQ